MAEPILLIGAGGFVGRRALEAFARRGESVVAVSRSAFDVGAGDVEPLFRAMREVSDYAPLLARVRAVVHIASASTPGSLAGKPIQGVEENVRPAVGFVGAMQARPELPLIYVSSGGTLYSRAR